MVTKEDLDKKRATIAEVKRAHREIEAAVAQGAAWFMKIDFDAAKRDRALGLVPDEEWDRFMEDYSLMRTHYRIFSEGEQAANHRAFEQQLEKQLAEMEQEYRRQNGLTNRLRGLWGKKD